MQGKYYFRIFLNFISLFFCSTLWAQNSSPVGSWKAVDDKTGQVLSIVQIYQTGSTLSGRVAKIMPVENQKPTDVCKKCKGKLKDAPVQGMVVIWGMQQISQDTWGKGRVLDPKSGDVYNATMKLINNGSQLRLRGYVLMPALGRSQTWIRAK